MKLVNATTGQPARIGDHIRNHRGEEFILEEWQQPRHPGSTGRVFVARADDPLAGTYEFYPSVFDLVWRE